MGKFRYEIYETTQANPFSFPLNIRNVEPVDNAEFVITETKQNDQVYYIKEIKNKLKLKGADFGHYYNQINGCIKYWVVVYKDCGSDGEKQIYKCYFNQQNIEYDLDKCECEIELKDSSIYNCFNERKTIETNVMEFQSPTTPPLPQNFKYDNTDPNTYRTISLLETVSWVLAQMACCDEAGCYFEVISDFFNWQYDGFGNLIVPTNQGTNPVNPSQPGYWIFIGAKSDFKNPTASNPARNLPMSFDTIEKIMTEVFNVYWVIDGFKVRFEHYSWFAKNMNYDTTIATNFPINEYKRKIKFDDQEFPSLEKWTWMEANDVDFIGLPIVYNPDCAGIKPKDRGISTATQDINYILNAPDQISDAGFVILDVYESGGQNYSYQYGGYISGITKRNARLSTANLHYDLHRHNRPFKTGDMNNIPTTFLSPVYNKIQDDIIWKMCCEDPYQKFESLVRTELGDGIIQEAEINFTKEHIRFKTKHE